MESEPRKKSSIAVIRNVQQQVLDLRILIQKGKY